MEGDNPASWVWIKFNGRYTAHELSIFERVLNRDCPECGAEPGKLCKSRNQREIEDMNYQHVRRRVHAPLEAPGNSWLPGTDVGPADLRATSIRR